MINHRVLAVCHTHSLSMRRWRALQAEIDRGSAYWAHRYVQNLAQIRYADMIREITAASAEHEHKASAMLTGLAARGRAGTLTRGALKKALDDHAADVLGATWKLADDLMIKYADG